MTSKWRPEAEYGTGGKTLMEKKTFILENPRPHVYMVEAQLSLCTDVDSQCTRH